MITAQAPMRVDQEQERELDDPSEYTELAARRPQTAQALQCFIAYALERASIQARGINSYVLKHRAEDWLRVYISNGEMKGALRAAGYAYRYASGRVTSMHDCIYGCNWIIACTRRRLSQDAHIDAQRLRFYSSLAQAETAQYQAALRRKGA
jgi:hypothetical protein